MAINSLPVHYQFTTFPCILRRRHGIKRLRKLLLPAKPRLSINLRRGLESRARPVLVQQTSAKHDLVVAEDFLLVVDVRCAVLAVVLNAENKG
jgi:hypothetical protein